MNSNRSIFSIVLTFIVLSFIFRYFWPLILGLLIVFIGFIFYLRYKSDKILSNSELKQEEVYENPEEQNFVKSNDVIDVEYTEHKE